MTTALRGDLIYINLTRNDPRNLLTLSQSSNHRYVFSLI